MDNLKTRSFPKSWRQLESLVGLDSARRWRVATRSVLLAIMAAVFSSGQVRAGGFNDGFELYVLGGLDSTLVGGPNEGTNGGANPWFGSAAPNLRVVGAENGVTPHGGTNMIRGCYNCLYDKDVDWFNLSFRCATGGVYLGNFALEWWFYDPLGALGG